MCRATQPKHIATISEDIMERTSRLLAALALGLALAGVTVGAAVAQPTPPTIEDHHDRSLRIQKADARGAQSDATLTEAEQRRIAHVREPYVPAPVPAAPAAKVDPSPAAADMDVLASLLVGLVGGVAGGVAALAGWTAATRRRRRQPASAT
jgi:hypothetical protein